MDCVPGWFIRFISMCIFLHRHPRRNDQDSYRLTEKYLLNKSPKSRQHRTLIQGNHSALKVRQRIRENIHSLPFSDLLLGDDLTDRGVICQSFASSSSILDPSASVERISTRIRPE